MLPPLFFFGGGDEIAMRWRWQENTAGR